MQPSRFFTLDIAQKVFWGAVTALCSTVATTSCYGIGLDPTRAVAKSFNADVQPLVANYCLKCHSAEKHKGDIDLEQFADPADVFKHSKPWERALEQLVNGEMPPADKPQPTVQERQRLISGVGAMLDAVAQSRAGDPGPVVLRRLNNAEYTYTIRDLTGIPSLDPVKEFPADSASGEGFMNVGNSLVMSPALVSKYLDAAKDITRHAVLLPDGIAFSTGVSSRDWTDEKLAAIRTFYSQFSDKGEGMAVNLQGIKFNTKDAGVLPIENYLAATLAEREAIHSGSKSLATVAAKRGLNAKYLTILWNALNDRRSSLLLDSLRAQWREAHPGDVAPLAASIRQWQQALWLFTSVGHIGKRDGPKAWQVPVNPMATNREVRLKIPSTSTNSVTLYLVASDAGDGNEHDFAIWDNPRLVAPGRPDLPLRDVRSAVRTLSQYRDRVWSSAADCLAASAETIGSSETNSVSQMARKHNVDPAVLAAWLNYLGLGQATAPIDSYMTQKLEKAESYDFVKGWIGADALSVVANSSEQNVRIPGNLKAHGVAVHPTPKLRVVVGWRSPVATTLHVEGTIQHAHTECGNGVEWVLELRRGGSRLRLAAGIAQDATEYKFGPFANFAVEPNDFICVSVGPRDGNHSCDLTTVDLKLRDDHQQWDLAKDVSPDILAGNPHADANGNPAVWHFYSEPDRESSALPVIPSGSLLAKWLTTADAAERQRLGREVQELLSKDGGQFTNDPSNAALYRQLTSLNGPLLGSFLRNTRFDHQTIESLTNLSDWGVEPSLFGTHAGTGKIGDTSLGVRAPSVTAVRLPTELAEGCELVAAASLQPGVGDEGSIQMQALTSRPPAVGLVAGAVREHGSKGTWSDGQLPAISDSPILVREGSQAQKRIVTAFDDFRQLFPAALCYTKIVPVDEVVTLTLFYREDEPLRRLMLEDAQAAELDRLWSELHYISQDALKSVDAFDQLWQFATQDADPKAFEPMREPIKQHAAEFRKVLLETQPAHVEAVLRFAEGAYRRPLAADEKDQLRGLYRKLRDQEIPHDQAVRLTMARVLTAPAFLYRAESAPEGARPGPVNDWELATRLSYFLWSAGPDSELRAAAASGRLHDPAVLIAHTRRMLRDPRVRRLATEFAAAWLQIHDFESLDEKSERHFPTFAGLRTPMYEEALRFFTDLFQNDGSVLSIIDADYTFLNETLAVHYGIPGVTGPEWRRVEGVKKYGRGGVLGFGAVLAKQSGASRTSPILRGNWVAEALLGDRLPPPPKDIPRLPEDEATESLTVRQLVEKHDADPRCAGCHVHIDGYGFALEAYDAIGALRAKDLAGHPIETRAKVFDGTIVNDAQGLRDYLLNQKRAAVLSQFGRKLLGYALGRAVILSDRPVLAELQRNLAAQDFRFSAAVEAVVTSPQFRNIRGNAMRIED